MREKEIRISNIYDGEIKTNPEFREWVESVAIFMRESLGPAPMLRVGAYHFRTSTGIAIDLFDRNDRCISVTAILSGTEARLPLEYAAVGQLDIALPGILDALHLIDILQKQTGAQIEVITM